MRKLKQCRAALSSATSYDEWKEAAQEHDRLTGMDAWKAEDVSSEYDWQIIKHRLHELRRLRSAGDVLHLAFFLNEGLHGNLGQMGNARLYQYAKFGTKTLIETYINEVVEALEFLASVEHPEVSLGDKIRYFSRIGKTFGRTALLLSGGATLGMFHIGVVKALVDEGLLPRVISGASAGSIIASVLGTHNDVELQRVFNPEYLNLQAWRVLGVRGTLKHKSVMDPRQLSDCLRDNVGDYTFAEAFERTGRIINITVSPADPHEQSRVLNYLTAPNAVVRRASLASCAVPGLFPPVELEAKDIEGHTTTYLPGRRWVDGSIEADLPMLRLARLHNANFYVVSQTNPHVVPFISDKRRRFGLIPFARELVTTSGRNTLKLARDHMGTNLVSNLLGKVHSMTNQRYVGDVTIFPPQPPSKLLKIISNPTPSDIRMFMDEGQRYTWPKLEHIRNASKISRTLDSCLNQLKSRTFGDDASRSRPRAGEKVVGMAQRVFGR